MPSPIPARSLTPAGVSVYTRRILALYRSAGPDALATGREWYPHAHGIARDLEEATYGVVTARAAAGVIAALSPQNLWSKNLADARKAVHARSASGLHVGCQTRKADAILAGADPLDVLAGPKERAFFGNIADPSDPFPVTIDRHAHDIAAGRPFGEADRGLSSVYRYANLTLAYRRAALTLGELPCTVQAVTWQVWTGRTTLDTLQPAASVDGW